MFKLSRLPRWLVGAFILLAPVTSVGEAAHAMGGLYWQEPGSYQEPAPPVETTKKPAAHKKVKAKPAPKAPPTPPKAPEPPKVTPPPPPAATDWWSWLWTLEQLVLVGGAGFFIWRGVRNFRAGYKQQRGTT